MDDSEWYSTGAFIVGALTFVGIWVYALVEWGLLLGLLFGWLPALIGAYIIGFLWPLFAFLLLLMLLSI